VGTVDLFHVVHVVARRNRDAHGLGNKIHQFDHEGLRHGQEALGRIDAGGQGDEGGPDPIARAIGDALNCTDTLEGPEEPCDGARRQVATACQLGDACRLAGQLLKQPEGPFDALDGSH